MSADEEFTPLDEIIKGRDDFRIRVKVHFLWKKYWVNNTSDVASIELVLVDQQGNKMRACIEKDTVKYYGSTFTKGRYLMISKFDVLDVDDHIKIMPNKLKLLIRMSSKIKKLYIFSLSLTDVCGRVINISRYRTIKERTGDKKKKLEFQLLAPSGERIRCALWREHGSRLLTVAKKNSGSSPPIVALIHNCQLKLWEGGREVNNIFFGTRLCLNKFVHPISTFNSVLANAPNKAELNAIPTMSPDFREDEQKIGAKFTKYDLLKVDQVQYYQQDFNFVVIGKVVKVCDSL
ncbi:uncharacterized protein [Rutidosis leptorrhynchoides]|uniref:uncharacterized protein n=1 Tax=Rutidosis leptorrhynchoides TaxID=125765 RepID=UPI003A998DE8